MADEYAWKDRDFMISLFKNLQKCLDGFIELAEKAHKFKMGVLDHPGRLAELKKLIDEDPNYTLTGESGQIGIQEKYNEFKAIYDYLNKE